MPASATTPDKILWTCLPNGINQAAAGGPALRIAVLVSPRLGSFALFSDWPDIVPHLTFEVEIKKDPAKPETLPPVPARVTVSPTAGLDPKLWASLFPPATFVQPHDLAAMTKRYHGKSIYHYPVRGVLNYIKRTHQNAEPSTPHQLPSAGHSALQTLMNEIGHYATNAGGLRDAHFAAMVTPPPMTSGAGVVPALAPGPASIASIDFYHSRPRAAAYRQAALIASSTELSGGSTELAILPAQLSSLPPPPISPTTPPLPNLDFHQAVSSLGDYPFVLRRLGLILDLEIPFTPAVPSDSQLRLKVSGRGLPPQDPQDQDPQPWTSYLLTDVFVAKPLSPVGPGSLHDGVMDLTGVDDSHSLEAANAFEIVQIDPDGAGAKLLNLSASLMRASPASAPLMRGPGVVLGPGGNDEVGLPSLRSAGLGLAKTDRYLDVARSIDKAFQWSQPNAPQSSQPNAPPLVVLHAEDLLRGYRVDILDETQGNTWRSLCARTGTYKLRDGSILDVPDDEGYVKAASTTSQYAPGSEDADPSSPLYLHENIFRWTGWSLCARRPGKTITDSGPAEVSNDAAPGNPTGLSVNFRPLPGSLPRLRFGHSYKLRLRAVDLAGGGLKLEDPPAFVSNSVVYARFDPIPPPAVVPMDLVSEGESIERLVIRSNYDKTAAQFAGDPVVQKALDGRQYAPTNDRHLVPPKTSLQMAETHSVLDKSIGGGANDQARDAGYNLALREAGTLADTAIIDVSTGVASIPVQGVKVVPTGPAGQSVIHSEAQLRTPYLPDVIARGAALSGVPGAGPDLQGGVVTKTFPNTVPAGPPNITVLKVPFSGTWPDTQPFRLRIAERPGTVPSTAAGGRPQDYDETFADAGQPKWDPVTRVLTVFLGKGQTARVRYSSYPDLSDVLVSQTPVAIPQLGYLHWRISPGEPPLTQQQVLALAEFAATGVNWQVSPHRELVLVHAVQQPLFAPAIMAARLAVGERPGESGAVRATLGNTTVTLAFTALFNGLSTGKLDLFASWKEPVDDPADDGPKQISGNAHVAELRIEPPLTTATGEVNYKSFDDTPHLFGDTKFRSVAYYLRATTAFREYFPPAITADPKNISRDGPMITFKVWNRARPAAPKPLYAVPSFRWDPVRPRQSVARGAKFSSRRLGGGLRVYLDRPWYSSGDGELLGVVLRPAGEPATDDDPMKNLVTTWGRDVIFQTPGPPDSEKTVEHVASIDPGPSVANSDITLTVPRVASGPPGSNPPNRESTSLVEHVISRGPGPNVANFRGHQRATTLLKLDEMAGRNVDVVGYVVQYDSKRKLWYADIEIDSAPSYCPFIRLALARYQPDSVAGAELSRVVLCDFAQLLPDRTVNLTASADGKVLQIDVRGFEPEESGVSWVAKNPLLPFFGRNHVDVAVEVRDPGNPDPDIGWLPAPTVAIAGGRPGVPTTTRTIVMPTIERAALRPGAAAPQDPAVLLSPEIPAAMIGSILWSGTITMPEPIGSGKYRLVIKEIEFYYDDDSQPKTDPIKGVASRLVYADVLDV